MKSTVMLLPLIRINGRLRESLAFNWYTPGFIVTELVISISCCIGIGPFARLREDRQKRNRERRRGNRCAVTMG